MHTPKHFEQTDVAAMHALIRAFPLGTLITRGDGNICVNHLPLHLAADGQLCGHVPKANPVWRQAADSPHATVVFQGPQAYITPSWYASKQQHGKVVPTWNYTAVHARGRIRVIDDPQWLREHLQLLTDQLEMPFATCWSVSDPPSDYTDRLLGHLIGIVIAVDSLEGTWKVSQNRPLNDREGVALGLRERGGTHDLAMAELVSGHGD